MPPCNPAPANDGLLCASGVKIDRVTPMGYLTDSKNALNEILSFK